MAASSRLGVQPVEDLVADAAAVGRRLGLVVDDPDARLPVVGLWGATWSLLADVAGPRLGGARPPPSRLGRGPAGEVILTATARPAGDGTRVP